MEQDCTSCSTSLTADNMEGTSDMKHTKHETKSTSTTCTACREWERDMNGTVATLEKARQMNRRLADSLAEVVRICEAMRYTAGLGKNQLERIARAKAAIAEAKASAA